MPGTQVLLRDRLRQALLFRELILRAAGGRSLAQSSHFPGSRVSAVEADVQEGPRGKGRRSNSCLKVPVTLAMSTAVLRQPPGENTPPGHRAHWEQLSTGFQMASLHLNVCYFILISLACIQKSVAKPLNRTN